MFKTIIAFMTLAWCVVAVQPTPTALVTYEAGTHAPFDTLITTLADRGLALDFLSEAAAPDAHLSTALNSQLRLDVLSAPLKERSALLVDVGTVTVASQDTARLAALIAYSAAKCDIALSLVNTSDFPALHGNCAVLDDDLDRAAAVYEADKNTPPINLAWVYWQLGRLDEAFALLDTYVDNAEADTLPTALSQRAGLHALAFNFDDAIADITRAIELEPENAHFYKQRGDHIFLIYEWDRVLADYNRAIELAPDYADAYFARGVLFYTQGPRPNALADFQTFLELAPHAPRAGEAAAYLESIEAELAALGGDDTGAFGPGD